MGQFGITWAFDRDYQTGQYANGEYWVVGPVTVTRITPADTTLNDAVDVHGSMVNPMPNTGSGKTHAFDSRVPDCVYDRNLNVARKLPLTLQPGSSLVSVSSNLSAVATNGDVMLSHAGVLTVVSAPPPSGSFRPPYAGTDKTILGTTNDLNFTIFRSFAPVSNTPALSTFDWQFQQPLIDLVPQWQNSNLKNAGGSPNYGRNIGVDCDTAVLSLNLNYTTAQKLPLLIKVVQRGIDTYGLAKAGMVWYPNGGHNTGRKLAMVVAAKALGRADMIDWANGQKHFVFQEDMQHWYITQYDVDLPRKDSTLQPYTSAMIGMAEWASNPITERNQTGSQWGKPYRPQNGIANTGAVLAAQIMGLRDEWNWEPLFDYINLRYWPIEGTTPTTTQTIPAFHANMWRAYRNSAPSPIDTDNTSTAGIWQNCSFAAQSGTFSCSFDMVPSANPMDGITGISAGASDSATDLAAAVRFSSTGRLEANNGSTFQSASAVSYQPGVTYRVSMNVDLPNRKYSATVTPAGGSAVVVAQNYAFRPEQTSVSSLNNVGHVANSGAQSVSAVSVAATIPAPTPTPTPTPTTPPPTTPTTTTPTNVWQNMPFAAQTGAFTCSFEATPGVANMDGVLGLSNGSTNQFTALGAAVRFNTEGRIDVRNGAAWEALAAVSYQAGVVYKFTLNVDLATHRYGVTVTPSNGAAVVIAQNYAFRSEQASVAKLDNLAFVNVTGSLTARNIVVTPALPPAPPPVVSTPSAWQNISIAPQSGTFTCSFEMTPGMDKMDGVVGLSNGSTSSFAALGVALRFNTAGYIDARNGGAYAAAASMPYSAGSVYKVLLNVNLATHRYTATVSTATGSSVVVAKDYAFRTEQAQLALLNNVAYVNVTGSLKIANVSVAAVAAATPVLRVNAGAGQYKDAAGNVWMADTGFISGLVTSTTREIADTNDDPLFQAIRYDNPRSGTPLNYAFSMANGSYKVRLFFVEYSCTAAKQRVFDVKVENQLVVDDLDIFSRVGAFKALVIEVPATVTDGVLNINLVNGLSDPSIAAIEVLKVN